MADRIEVIKTELERIRRAHRGRFTAEHVVAEARKKSNPLHKEFIWDDRKAAHKQRIERARELIAWVTVTVTYRNTTLEAPIYVRDPNMPTARQGYVALEEQSERNAHQIILAEIDRCRSCVMRARAVAGSLSNPKLASMLEGLLESLLTMRGDLAAAAE